MAKKKQKFDDATEEARQKSIRSYRNLVDKAFANILNDTDVVIQASQAMKKTGELVENDEDVETGKYMEDLMTALHEAAKALKEKYKEKFSGFGVVKKNAISGADWARLDKALKKAPYDTEHDWREEED